MQDQYDGSGKRKKSDNIPWFNQLGVNQIGKIIKFLPLNQQLELRLVSQQFKSSVERSLTKFDYFCSIENLDKYNKFIANFPNLKEVSLPSIYSVSEFKGNEQLQKVEFNSFPRHETAAAFMEKFFKQYQPISIGLREFKNLEYVPHLSQLKELNLTNVFSFKNPGILNQFHSLVSLAFNVHEHDDFFLYEPDIQLPYLRMLKIRIWGPNFEQKKIRGLQNFVEGIPKVEVLELVLEIHNETKEKQIVLDSFMSLPNLKTAYLQNCSKQIIETQLKQILDLLIFENNTYTQEIDIIELLFDKFLAFTKVLDITNCKLEEKNQLEINQWLNEKRKTPSCFIQTSIIKTSFDHCDIQTNYEQSPIVQRNDQFKTLWGSQYYSI